MIKWISTIVLAGLLTAAPAWAQEDDPDIMGSGVITPEQMSEDISVCITKFENIVVFYVLPRGWEGAEQGIDRETGRLDEELNRYVLLSRSPMAEDDEAPDFVFELSIYREVLPEEWDAGLSEEERSEMEESAFWDFVNMQMGVNAKAGWHCVTPQSEIKAKPYSTGTRQPTFFVPIFYEREGKVNIYTFTSITAGKIWGLKFLVKSDQIDNYGALIAYIINNAFAMPEEDFEEYQRQYNKDVPQTPED
jgi:hypothetical protein